MSWFRVKAVDSLSSAVAQLRSDLLALRSLVLEQAQEIATLRQERALRETEMADLRTRYETLIKRIGARQQKQEELSAGSDFSAIQRRRRVL